MYQQSIFAFSTLVDILAVPLPSLSPTMTHGTISVWNKKPGDTLAPGDILCDVETDKASVGFEYQDDGVLAKIVAESKGQEIKCGEPIALVVNSLEDYKKFLELSPSAYANLLTSSVAPSSTPPTTPTPTPQVSSAVSLPPTPTTPAYLSPAARHLVESQSLDISTLHGTARGARRIISKEDVVNALQSGTIRTSTTTGAAAAAVTVATTTTTHSSAAPLTAPQSQQTTNLSSSAATIGDGIGGRYTDVPNSNMRKVIAKRLTESKTTVPHMYTAMECNIDDLLSFRSSLKKEYGVNISVNDMVIKSAALALRDVPECNGRWVPESGQSVLNDSIDISVAVATPNGLITPILSRADQLGLSSISSKVKDLATRARDGKLQPKEYQGGTFTISNLGMFGISSFTAVINPPQACILAVGGGVARVSPTKDGKDLKAVTTMTVQLSSDRRVVDEALAAQYLQAFRYYLSNPKLIML